MSDSAPKKHEKPTINGHGTVFDIKRPGKTPIQSTSRPVIVGHKPIVRDPFTTGKTEARRPAPTKQVETEPLGPAATPELAAVAAELTKEPEPKPQVPEPSAVHEEPKPASESGGKNEVVPEPVQTDEQKVAEKDYVPGSDAPLLPPEPAVKPQVLSPEIRKQLDAVAHERSPAPEPEGVVVSGEHGPLNFVKVLLWFVAVIALVIVIGDVLLDAGTITTSVNIPHTHFIK